MWPVKVINPAVNLSLKKYVHFYIYFVENKYKYREKSKTFANINF